MLHFIFFLFLFIFAACNVDTQLSNSDSLPEVNITCYSGSGCTSTHFPGPKVYIGLKEADTTYDCLSELTGMTSHQFEVSFDASASKELAYSNFTASATLDTWVDTDKLSVLELTADAIQICAYVDLNKNGLYDGSDLYHSSSLTKGESQISIEDWN